MQLLNQTRLLFALALLGGCVLTGCDIVGGDDLCEGRSGFFLQTDRDTYQSGQKATLTAENCTGRAVTIFNGNSRALNYSLKKDVGGEWQVAATGGGGMSSWYNQDVKIESGDSREFEVSVEPRVGKYYVGSIPGSYRYELTVFYGDETVEEELPQEAGFSNTFEVTEAN